MAVIDAPVGAEQGVRATLADLVNASNVLGSARKRHAEEFLLAKIRGKGATDRQAEASAEVKAGEHLLAAETKYFIARVNYESAMRRS